MKFDTSNLHRFAPNCHPSSLRNTTDPLILIKPNGEIRSANNRRDKDRLLFDTDFNNDQLLYAWSGVWRRKTEIFVVTQEDIENYYRPRCDLKQSPRP
jgi:hypothetical protein